MQMELKMIVTKVHNIEHNKLVLDKFHEGYKIANKKHWCEITYSVEAPAGIFKEKIKVDSLEKFITDGRSGNCLVNLIIPKWGRGLYRWCWYVHDELYSLGSTSEALPFEFVNSLFLEMMKYAKISPWRAKLAFIGVSSKIGENCYYKAQEYDNHNKKLVSYKVTSLD